mgnify:CR=1 FL=1
MVRPDPLIPNRPGAEDIEAMRNRTIWLNQLYEIDGRVDLDHPFHGLYTGLHAKYINEVG